MSIASVAATRSGRWFGMSLVIVLAAALGGLLLFGRRVPAESHVPNPEAVRAYQRARFGDNAGRVQIQSGIRNYQEAVRLDPSFSDAWAGLATAHTALTWFGEVSAKETMTQAKREAARSLELNASNGAAWRVLEFASHFLDWDHATSEQPFRRAIQLSPQDAVAASWFAEFLVDMRRFDEALIFARRSQDVAPRWLGSVAVAGNIQTFSGRPDLAILEYQRALEIEPNYGLANHFLGRAYLANGQHRTAVQQLRKSSQLLGEVPFAIADLGHALAIAGERDEAERIRASLIERRQAGYYPAFAIALIEMGLGRFDAALDWLERAAEERTVGYYLPSVDPIYDPLRTHPRFKALLRRMNLPGA